MDTRSSGSSVNFVINLKPPTLAVTIDVVAQCRSTCSDRSFEQVPHVSDEPLYLEYVNTISRGPRMQAAGKEQLIDVDIAQTCDDMLIEQDAFDRTACVQKTFVQLAGRYACGIGSKMVPAA